MAKAKRIFLEVVLPVFIAPSSRWVFEDRIRALLVAEGLGDVTGGGGGGTSNIDVEVTDVAAGLGVIKRVMEEYQQYECAGVVVKQYEPVKAVHRLDEPPQDAEPVAAPGGAAGR